MTAIPLSFIETGDPTAPAIVFLHGGGLSRRMWQPQLESLVDFHCLAPDLPEHGQSRSIAPFTLEDSARQVAALIREKVPEARAHLVGLSLGGAVTLTMLRQAPEVVATAMVSGTAAKINRFLGAVSEASLWMLRLYKPEQLVQATARQMGIPGQYRELFDEDLLFTSSEEFNRRLIRELVAMQLPDQVKVPLLACVGARETVPAKQAARKLVGLYPSARGVIIPEVGHVWNLQKPELFTRVVRAWICDESLPPDLLPLKQSIRLPHEARQAEATPPRIR
jgi:pimeloyl-ACP methyl ester carboxylesterase